MDLSQALGIRVRDVVVFVGAGGKTTAMFRLADELAAVGLRVVSTTTTRIGQDELDRVPHYLQLGESPELPAGFPGLLAAHRHLFVFSRLGPPSKIQGVSPDWIDVQLARHPAIDVVLVEADGSRRLPLKAPYPHEPAMPKSATVVVPVAGLNVLGQPLDDKHVYGADLVAQRTGGELGEPVTPRVLADVLGGDDMGLKDAPSTARIIPLLNRVTTGTLPAARRIASQVLHNRRVARVVIGAVGEAEPVREVRRRVTGVVLAAGQSERMGEAKLLLPWGDGSTIIRNVCAQAAAADLTELLVVTGGWREQVEAAIADLPLRVVHNPQYAEGEMLSSVQAALRAAPESSEAVLIFLGDQPAVQEGVVADVLNAYAEGCGTIVAPVYEGRRGHPVLIDRVFWDALLRLPVGAAPRDVLRAHEDEVCEVPVDTPSVLQDIDTPDDYEQARR